MKDIVILRFAGPLMGFGSTMVDNIGTVQPYPALSSLAGFVANALGLEHAQVNEIQDLQTRLEYAVREDVQGEIIQDYQTVDLGLPGQSDKTAWTTRGSLEQRRGGRKTQTGTHIRQRPYVADGVLTIALTLSNSSLISYDRLVEALNAPARPLFFGRKPCVPTRPVFWGTVKASSCASALCQVPLDRRGGNTRYCRVWGDQHLAEICDTGVQLDIVRDGRNWEMQSHTLERSWYEGVLAVTKIGEVQNAT